MELFFNEKGSVFEINYPINKEVKSLREGFSNEFIEIDSIFSIKFDRWKIGKEKRKYMVT